MYVSDLLEEIFFNIAPVRALVRRQNRTLLKGVTADIRVPLSKKLDYWGGKCMGFPAVWLVGRWLNIDLASLRKLVEENHTALNISLSTSIADEILDRETTTPGKDLMTFYLLIFKALSNGQWHKNGLGDFVVNTSIKTMDIFIEDSRATVCSQFEKNPSLALKRIGNFHKMIAFDLLKHRTQSKQLLPKVVDVARKFGEWCAALDDFIDLPGDLKNGQLNYFSNLVLSKKNIYSNSDKMISVLENDLNALANEVGRLGHAELEFELELAAAQLRPVLNAKLKKKEKLKTITRLKRHFDISVVIPMKRDLDGLEDYYKKSINSLGKKSKVKKVSTDSTLMKIGLSNLLQEVKRAKVSLQQRRKELNMKVFNDEVYIR